MKQPSRKQLSDNFLKSSFVARRIGKKLWGHLEVSFTQILEGLRKDYISSLDEKVGKIDFLY
jgi:hypothetical protein